MSTDAESDLRTLLAAGDLDLADPGTGRTSDRLLALFELARTRPVSVARLAEAHTDAVAILHEAGRQPRPSSLYGVWASAGSADVRVVTAPDGGQQLRGVKPFASGLRIVDRALVTVIDESSGERLLYDVELAHPTVQSTTDQWVSDALRDSATGAAEFVDHDVSPADIVAGPGWYLDRVGFWHGACAPAACWAGAVAGLLDAAEDLVDDDPHRRAHLGALRADEHPDEIESARSRAYAVRHIVERLATDILDRFGRAFGPRPFATDAEVSQRWADSHLYLRQHHGERNLAELGRMPWTT
jgi:alkylation response protein AidB-like acyl-CoA dehydrogenase/plasmid stabilization system protein ParE